MSDHTQAFGGYGTETTPAPAEPTKTTDTSTSGLSVFDELLAEADTVRDTIETFSVKGRKGFTVTFDTDFGSRDIKRWNNMGQGKRKKAEDADRRLIWGALLIEQNRGIFKNGVQVVDPRGEEVTLGHKAFVDAYTKDLFVKTAVDAAMEFFGEGQAFAIAEELVGLAGFGEDAEHVDPTNG